MKPKYKVDSKFYSELNNLITLPRYQRRLVWTDKQKREFVANISQGFPFGSVLLYKYENDEKVSLIDGLQRYNTLRDYDKEPAKFFTKYEEYTNQIVELVDEDYSADGGSGLSEDQRESLKPQFEMVLRDFLADDDPDYLYLFENIKGIIPFCNNETMMKRLTSVQKQLDNAARDFLDLDGLIIPCIVFLGEENQLAEVFANVNQGGTKLTKYQVFAAQWSKHEFVLPDTEIGKKILEKVISRYKNLEEKRDLEIEGFDDKEMLSTRKVNLSEYCFALGELIVERAKVFWPTAASGDIDKKEDVVNVAGYLSVAIALGVDNRHLNELADKAPCFENEAFVDTLSQKILAEYEKLQSILENWLRLPGDKVGYESGSIADMQALSFFAALWKQHWNVSENPPELVAIPNYKSKGYDATCRNIPAHCVCDVVTKAWQGSGDSRLANYYVADTGPTSNYLFPVTKEAIEGKLSMWYQDVTQKGSMNVDKVSKLLLCIYAAPNRIDYISSQYDIEHVISKKQLRQGKIYSEEDIPGGTLGNLMYLKSGTNRGKKDLNLYSLEETEGIHLEEEYLDLVDYPTREEIVNAEQGLKEDNADPAKKMIESRARTMIAKVIESLVK